MFRVMVFPLRFNLNMVFSISLTKTLAKVGLLIYEHLGRNDVAEWHEHLEQILISKLLG